MIITLSTIIFLVQLLCSSHDCDFRRPTPYPEVGAREGRSRKFSTNIPPIANTKTGTVQGFKGKVMNGRDIFSFEGIPYALPPVGNLRFRDPIPISPWIGIRKAMKPSPNCLQLRGPARGREDCLYLNVYTPMLPQGSDTDMKFPVIIWIHGGSFLIGSGSDYGPYYLLNRDVILVTINYRLGVLGFMSTGDDASPGNYGLKDQALAIKWVHDNIEYFGGDPNRVSLIGQSAGGASVHFQMMSTTSIAKGMFHSGSSLSGTAFSTWALQTPAYARKLTTKLAKSFGCPMESGSGAIVECFRKMDGNVLVAGQPRLFELFIFPPVLFAPVIEPNTTAYPFLTDTPVNYYERNEVAKIPWLCTTTEHEADITIIGLRNIALLPSYLLRWRQYMRFALDLKGKVDDVDFVLDKLVKNYFGDQDPLRANPRIWSQVATDRYYHASVRVALKYHSKLAPAYSYIFGFTSRVGVTELLFNDYREWGSSHAEDLSVIFNCTKLFPPIVKGEPAYYMMNIMTNLLANFAAKGKPYYTIENGTDVAFWDPIKDPENMKFLRLNSGNITMIPDPFKERLEVWKTLNLY